MIVKEIVDFDLGKKRGYPYIEIFISATDKNEFKELRKYVERLGFWIVKGQGTMALLHVTNYAKTKYELLKLFDRLEKEGFKFLK